MKLNQSLAKFVLVLVAVITGLLAWQALNTRFNYEFEDYFPKSDSDYEYYNQFRERFSSDNDFVLICLTDQNGIFNQSFLSRVDSLSKELRKQGYVDKVINPIELGYPLKTAFGLSQVKWFHVDQPERYSADSTRIFESKELIGSVISLDGKSLSVVLTTTPGLSKIKSDEAVIQIQSVLDKFQFDDVQTAGRIFGQKYVVEKMVGELTLFTSISLVIIIIFLIVAFRSAWGVVVPLVVVAVSIIWLVGLMRVLGKDFDLMSTLLPTILFVVGMSDVIHFLSRYLEELRAIPSPMRAVRIAFMHIGRATFLTSLTTAIGFLTLLTSGITPVRDFGLYTALGVLIAFVVTFLILPGVLVLLPIPKRALVQSDNLFWNRVMHNLFQWVLQRPKGILAVTVLILGLSFWGISRVSVNNYLLEDLSSGDEMRQQFEFFEDQFSGARPFEAVIQTTNGESVLDYNKLKALDSVEYVIREVFDIYALTSVNSVVKNLNRANKGGAMEEYTFPSEKKWKKINKQLGQVIKTGRLKEIMDSTETAIRITGRVRDYGGKEFKKRYVLANERIKEVLSKNNLEIRYTGMAYLIDKNNETLASGLMSGLVIAFGVVAIIMGLLFKSIRIVFLTLVPNVMPLLAIGGLMGLFGIDLKVSTSIIFTIAFGIAVDDTIHYMSKLKMELGKGKSLIYALKRTSISTGKAIVLTSLILMSGFFALVFSDFASTYYIGLLVSVTLLFAVISDLILLPILLLLFYKNK